MARTSLFTAIGPRKYYRTAALLPIY